VEGIEIAAIDKILVVLYFVFVFGFGSYFGRYIKNTTDFFFSGRKFSWWVVSVSMIATVVGSYSFIKYSAAGYRYGLSSSMSYLNDWFFLPLWMFAWLPIIYFTRMTSIPEYFERRFDTPTRVMAILFVAVYLIGYIGINFYTLGVALHALLGMDVMVAAAVVAVITGIYVTSGGQTAVIMTDLLQGVLLLVAGLSIFVLGFLFLGDGALLPGVVQFWDGLDESKRYGLAHFNEPPNFSFIGVFWQDAIASSFAAYFFNQGILMRFLALKSVNEGRKAIVFALAILMPIAVIAVGNAGWIGASMDGLGVIPAAYSQDPDPNKMFVIVTSILCKPGIFGLVMAALLAALMSTADTLINATSAIVVNDIWRPYIVRNRPDEYYLKVARWASIASAILGLFLVPLFMRFDSIYVAHGAFIATVTPPMAVCIVLGFLWPRFTARAAFATLLGGAVAMGVSIWFPALVEPFSHGVDPEGGFKYMRALYGLVVSGIIGVVVTFLTQPSKSAEEIVGLTIYTVRDAERRFKGGEINRGPGDKLRAKVRVVPATGREEDEVDDVVHLSLHPDDLRVLGAHAGDLIFLADPRVWLGGLRAGHARVQDALGERGVVELPEDFIERNQLQPERGVVVEKLM
jgi:SSS family solute:Na+ symporter